MSVDSSTSVPLPDYEVEQYLPRGHFDESPEEVGRLRQHYDCVYTYSKRYPVGHRDLQRWLNQTRMDTACDLYLTQPMKLALVTAAFGSLVGLALTFVLARTDVLVNASSPVGLGVATEYVAPFAPYRVPILGAAPAALVGGLMVAGTYYAQCYLPEGHVEMHSHSIGILLPHAIVCMYVLSHSGASFLEVIRSVTDAPDYGKMPREFEMIARDMDLFGNDLFMTLRNSRNLIPSINFEQFLDDLLSVLGSGNDVATFLDRESAMYLEEARDKREDFIETLSMLSGAFVTAFVAAPLLLIVTLIVISLLGGDTLVQLYTLNCLIFSLGMRLFPPLMDVLSSPYTRDTVRTKHDVIVFEELRTVAVDFLGAMRREVQRAREARWDGDNIASDGGFVGERFDDYRRENAVYELRTLVGDPLDIVHRQSCLSAIATVPFALLSVAGVLVLGLVALTLDIMLTDPYNTTVWFIVPPFAIVAVPLTVSHELRIRHERMLERRFPDTLNLPSSTNRVDISLVESLALVSRWSTGALADELHALHNSTRWNHDARAAPMAFATRLNVPQSSRVIRLIASGGRTSGNLSRVLSVAAENTHNCYKLEKSHRRAMDSYAAIVVIRYFVYLFVILMIGASYLGPLAEISVSTAVSSGQSLPVGISLVPLTNFHVVFFHSALVQAVDSGLLAGRLADNNTLNGLKYTLRLSALALVAFALA